MSCHASHNPFEFIPSVLGGVVGGVAANLVGFPVARKIRNATGWRENPGLPNPDEISVHGFEERSRKQNPLGPLPLNTVVVLSRANEKLWKTPTFVRGASYQAAQVGHFTREAIRKQAQARANITGQAVSVVTKDGNVLEVVSPRVGNPGIAPFVFAVGNPPAKHGPWKVSFMRRGDEPPRPFGKTSQVVFASSREEAINQVPYSPYYPVTAKRVSASDIGPQCDYCKKAPVDRDVLMGGKPWSLCKPHADEFESASRGSNPRKRRANIAPSDHDTRPTRGPRMQVKLPRHMVKGTITLREAIRRDIPGIRAAIKGFPKFHGSIDPDEEVIIIDDGRKDSVAGFLIGRAPEVVYDQVPNGSNKEGSIWVHKTSKEKPTYLVHIPQTGHSMLLGAMRVSDWLRG